MNRNIIVEDEFTPTLLYMCDNVVLVADKGPRPRLEVMTWIRDTSNAAAIHNARILAATRYAEITGDWSVPHARQPAPVAFNFERFCMQLEMIAGGGHRHIVERDTPVDVIHCNEGGDAE